MLLYLFRHGIAISRDDPKCPQEAERYLTIEGRKRTLQAAKGLLALGVRPKAMLTSAYVRSRETAEIAAEVLGFPKKKIRMTDALLPQKKAALVFRELSHLKENEVMCFGHAPNLDEVIAHALGLRSPKTELKKSGVAALELSSLLSPRGKLLWLMTPKALRFVGG